MTADPWVRVIFAARAGGWRISAHRGAPDGWAILPDRWGTRDEAEAAAAAWTPTTDRPRAADVAPLPVPVQAKPSRATTGQLNLF